MPVTWKLAVALAAVAQSIAAPAIRPGAVQAPLTPQVEIRRATPADSGVFVNITITAFQELEDWKYLHQFQDQYPYDTYDCVFGVLRDALSSPLIVAHLGVVPAAEPPHEKIAVSASLWKLPEPVSQDTLPVNIVPAFSVLGGWGNVVEECQQRDVNMTSGADFSEQFDRKVNRPLEHMYPPEQQLLLESIGTIPAYQGRDIAGHLLRKGLAAPEDMPDNEWPERLYATLAATTDGEPLYMENGYESIANATLTRLDGLGTTRFDIMSKQLRP